MYARIARFEAGSPEVIEREVDRLRRDIAATQTGGATDPTMLALSRVVDRVVMMVDRENAAAATIVFCDSEEKLHEADRILDGMSPQSGEGRRASRDMFEVVLDESPRAQQKAA
jgi:hypothetical protein